MGADGDWFSGKDYMGDYSGGRQVQDAEVNELLAPALRLAEQTEGDNITIHFFNKTDENGNETSGGGKYNTCRVYDSEKRSYIKSETVPIINSR